MVVRVSYALPSKKYACSRSKTLIARPAERLMNFVPFIDITKRETGKDLGFFASWLPSTLYQSQGCHHEF